MARTISPDGRRASSSEKAPPDAIGPHPTRDRLHTTGTERDDDHLHPVSQVELGHGVAEVHLHGMRGDVDPTGDLQTVEALRGLLHGGPLTWG